MAYSLILLASCTGTRNGSLHLRMYGKRDGTRERERRQKREGGPVLFIVDRRERERERENCFLKWLGGERREEKGTEEKGRKRMEKK